MDTTDTFVLIYLGFIMGMIVAAILVLITSPGYSLNLNQETGDDICRNLTGNESTVASSLNGKLTCKIPSFDETQNIIIEKNNE